MGDKGSDDALKTKVPKVSVDPIEEGEGGGDGGGSGDAVDESKPWRTEDGAAVAGVGIGIWVDVFSSVLTTLVSVCAFF